MSLLRNISDGLRSLFRKERVSQDLDEELNGFLEMAAEEKMKQGMSRKDALRAVRLERGNLEVTKEEVRSAGWESFVETLWQDLRFAVRMLRKSPGFAAFAVLTLALGIGANTAIFSLVNGVLLRPLPYAHPEQIVKIWDRSLPKGSFAALRERLQTMEVATYAHESGFNLMNNGEAIRVVADGVSGNLFSVLGVSPQLGRNFV